MRARVEKVDVLGWNKSMALQLFMCVIHREISRWCVKVYQDNYYELLDLWDFLNILDES